MSNEEQTATFAKRVLPAVYLLVNFKNKNMSKKLEILKNSLWKYKK